MNHGPLFIVVNAASGSGDAASARTLLAEELSQAGREHEFLVADSGDQIERLTHVAADRAFARQGAVVAVGGDGTINAAATAVFSRRVPLGVIAQGTFNYTTRAHNIPKDVRQAVHALMTAQVRPVQVGLVNERLFLVNASVGIYPELLEDREVYNARFGRYRAVAIGAGLRTLFREHRQLALEIEHDQQHERLRTPSLFIGNNALQLQQLGLNDADADQARRRLTAAIVKPVSTAALLGLALRGALGKLGNDERLRTFDFTSMTVSPPGRHQRRKVKVAMDGEVCTMRAPLHFRVAADKLNLLVPTETPA